MMDAHHDNPIAVIALSAVAGLVSWVSDPNALKALAVAAACGFVGGLAKAAGVWTWNKVRERRNKKREG